MRGEHIQPSFTIWRGAGSISGNLEGFVYNFNDIWVHPLGVVGLQFPFEKWRRSVHRAGFLTDAMSESRTLSPSRTQRGDDCFALVRK